jgi:tryptophan synthase alpha chain
VGAERYAKCFAALKAKGEGAFVPFLMLGDPSPAGSLELARAAIAAGADMLELGIPFSDPVADGPTIQFAAQRALAGGATPGGCFELLSELRAGAPDLPIGLLVYANLVVGGGRDAFYARAAAAGVDSVLVADVPTFEIAPFVDSARGHGIAPVLIAPPNASPQRLDEIAAWSEGYTYVVARRGVTGADEDVALTANIPAALRERGAAPPVFGFGISHPDHVRAALAAGAAGAISGSAIVKRIAPWAAGEIEGPQALSSVSELIAELKAATRG